MSIEKSRFDKTAAEDKSIGFDYQYYYFLLQLLKLRSGEKIGLEVKDDIHLETPDKRLTLVQLKHTTRETEGGQTISLAERSSDIWKSISNWIDVIRDSADGRAKKESQLEFLKMTNFVLVSNKEQSMRNKFLLNLSLLKQNEAIIDFQSYLDDLIANTVESEANKDLREHMQKMRGLPKNLLLAFVKNIEFQLGEDDLITRIKEEIKRFMISPPEIEDVYAKLNSALRDNIYINVKNKIKIELSFDDFYSTYRACFTKYSKLPIRRSAIVIPTDCLSQTFIKQLVDIGDITVDDQEEIIEYTKYKLLAYNNLTLWVQNGELTEEQRRVFKANTVIIWKNHFKASHRNLSSTPDVIDSDKRTGPTAAAAFECLDKVRQEMLIIEGQSLEIDISNGQFYLLSDEPIIGWHRDWKQKYQL